VELSSPRDTGEYGEYGECLNALRAPDPYICGNETCLKSPNMPYVEIARDETLPLLPGLPENLNGILQSGLTSTCRLHLLQNQR
jgi:hypothetical protein